LLAVIIAVVAMVWCSGCILLAIPSLGYEGYKYHKTGSLTGNSSSSPAPTSSKSQSSKTSSSSSSGGGGSNDHSIE
jgi:uncharacterized membrane protein YgcG